MAVMTYERTVFHIHLILDITSSCCKNNGIKESCYSVIEFPNIFFFEIMKLIIQFSECIYF